MKFIADAMLGRLARWLRFMGYDTLYYPDIPDSRLLRLSREENRLILTRDTHFRRRGIDNCLFINSDDVFRQVAEVTGALGLKGKSPGRSRCANCNGVLEDVEKRDVSDAVPEYVYANFGRFQRCALCGNVYWKGSHYKRLIETLDKIT